MSETCMVNFRLDKEVKRKMEQACKEMGLSMSTAFTIFATKVGREKRIPFEVGSDPFYSEQNMAYLKDSIDQLEHGRVVVKTMEELEALANA